MPSSRARTSWRISECPDRGHRARRRSGEFVARPIGERAVLARERLGEDRLAGSAREAFIIVADRGRARLAGLGRQAEVPFGVVLHPRGHVDHHRAGEARRRRPGKDMPEHGRAERPADPDRALEVERLGELGDVGGHPLDRRRGAVRGARAAVAAQVDRDDPEIVGQRLLRARRSPHAPSARAAARSACRCPQSR